MFDDIIKGKAHEHEAPVPPDAWDNIAKKKKKRRVAFWWWSSALLLLMTLSTGGYFLLNSKKNDAVAAVDKNKVKQIANKEGSKKQESKKTKEQNGNMQDGETTMPSLQQTTDADNAATNDVSIVEVGSKNKKNIVAAKTKATITISANAPGEKTTSFVRNNKKSKYTKGKLKATQTTPGIDENLAVNENTKADSDNTIAEEAIKEKTDGEENKQATIAAITDKKTATTEEEKKINETADNKKENAEKPVQAKNKKTIAVKQKIKKHWFIEAAAIPLLASSQYNKNISFRRTVALNNSLSVYKANLATASIEPAVAFSFLLRRDMSKKIAIGTGLQYMLLKENMSINGKETNTTYTVVNRLMNGQLVPDTVTTVTEGTRSVKAVNSYQLFSIPVFAQYNIIQKPQWSVNAVGGFYFNISSNYKNEINRNATAPLLPAPGTSNKSNTGMDIFAGIRVGKRLSKRLDLFAMPSIRLSLAKYNIKNSLLDKNINQAGVGFGMCYKIK